MFIYQETHLKANKTNENCTFHPNDTKSMGRCFGCSLIEEHPDLYNSVDEETSTTTYVMLEIVCAGAGVRYSA